jgi:hypothetical protein
MRISTGVLHMTSNFSKLSEDIRKRMPGLIKETTEAVADEYEKAITTGVKSGRRYGSHQASAAGEPPAGLTGELVSSVKTEYPSEEEGIMRVQAYYARMLEFGTKRMAARPTLRPLMKRKSRVYRKGVKTLVKESISASGVK